MNIAYQVRFNMLQVFPTGWRKISCFFNVSFEIRDKSIEFDENRNVQRAEFVVRAYMQYVSCSVVAIHVTSLICFHFHYNHVAILWLTQSISGEAGSQMDGALVSGARSAFRNQIMT